jgi:Pyridoxamine 5'-phosphate oxidase
VTAAQSESGAPDVDQVLAKPLMAHLATGSPDGARHSPVWFLWEDGAVWLIGNHRDGFPRRIQQDGRCAIGVVDFDLLRGKLVHVGMRGAAEVVALDRPRLYRLLSRYLGSDRGEWNADFRRRVIDHLDLMVRFLPSSVVARDQSYFAANP